MCSRLSEKDGEFDWSPTRLNIFWLLALNNPGICDANVVNYYSLVADISIISDGTSCEKICNDEEKICNGVGCLLMSCPSCFEDQNSAIRDVEAMLNRLEEAEALYPSSKAFAAQYPLYLKEEFTARVKVYNVINFKFISILFIG